jgi:hypothetical protein
MWGLFYLIDVFPVEAACQAVYSRIAPFAPKRMQIARISRAQRVTRRADNRAESRRIRTRSARGLFTRIEEAMTYTEAAITLEQH